MRLTQAEKTVITEVKRRISEFKNGNKNATMVFLGHPSEVKSLIKKGILTPYSEEIKRVLNWYNLTDKGRSII